MKTMTIREAVQRIGNALKIGEYNLAEKLLTRVAGKIPDNLFVLISLGNIYVRSGRYGEAFALYEKAITLFPASPEAYNNLGLLYKNTGKYDLAARSLEKALELAGDRPDIYYNLGNVYKEMKRYEAAISAYNEALKADPAFIHTYNNLGVVYEMRAEHDKARQVYSQGLSHDPNNPGLHYNLGVLYQNGGNYREAAEEFRKAIRIKSGWVDAMNNYGIVLGELNAPEEAIRMFDEVLKLEPANFKAMNNSGIVYAKSGEPEKAIDCYRRAVRQNQEYYNGILNLGILLEENGYYLEALQEFARLVKLQPYDLAVRIRYAGTLIFLERYREAVDQLKFIIRNDPQNIRALRVLGSAYIRMENFQAAAEIYNSLMKLDREHSDFYFDLALMFNDSRDYGRSEAHVKKYLEQNPDDANAILLLGEIFYNRKEWNKAEELFKRLIGTHPEITKPYYYLARIYSEQEQHEDAVKMFEQLVTLQGNRAGYADIDNINASLQMYEESTARYERNLRSLHEEHLLKPDGFVYDTAGAGEAEKGNPDVMADIDAGAYKDHPPVSEAIINKGLKEPSLTVKEEEEVIDLDKAEKKAQVVELDDEPHTPLTNLLENEELYEDSPLIKDLAARQNWLDSRQKKIEQEMETAFTLPPQDSGLRKTNASQPILPSQAVNTQEQTSQSQPIMAQQPVVIVPPPIINPPPVQSTPTDNQQTKQKLSSPANLRDSSGQQKNNDPSPLIREEAIDMIQSSLQTLAELLNVKQQIIPVPVYIPQPPVTGALFPQRQEEKKVVIGNTVEKSEGKELKNQLRSFLKKVREKLDTSEVIEVPADSGKKEHMIGLLDHLVKLQEDLPPGALPNVNLDDMKVRIEFLREKLAGKKGLKKKIEEMYNKVISESALNGSHDQIYHTLEYIKKMVHYLPDHNIRNALTSKINTVIRKMPH